MKVAELRSKDSKSLNDELKDLRQKEFKLKMQHGSGQLAATHKLRDIGRNIARVHTILTEKQRSEA
jgi:large subunit ribosomal protein L29